MRRGPPSPRVWLGSGWIGGDISSGIVSGWQLGLQGGKDWRAGSSRMHWEPQWSLLKWKDCSRARGQRRPKLERQKGAFAGLRHLEGNEVTALNCWDQVKELLGAQKYAWSLHTTKGLLMFTEEVEALMGQGENASEKLCISAPQWTVLYPVGEAGQLRYEWLN